MFGDVYMLALTIWREARGEGIDGMTAVGCVVRNRVTKNGTSYYREIVKPWQFTSISVKSDPEVNLWPGWADTQWLTAQDIAQEIVSGGTVDTTGGAVNYYANTIEPPEWVASMTFTVQIGKQLFYK